MDQPDEQVFYCRTCRRALNRIDNGQLITWCHAAELRGEPVDHPADRVPITDLDDPLIECDLCTHGTPTTVYLSADQHTQLNRATGRVVGLGDYHRRHRAARTLRVETEPGMTTSWGRRWSACDDCATHIDQRDLLGLIRQVTAQMPPKMLRGARLARTRAHLHALYSDMFATLQPKRGRITAEHPLGRWETD